MTNHLMHAFRIVRSAVVALAVAIPALAILTSCDDTEYESVSLPAYSIIATLDSNRQGAGSVFTYRTGETTPLVTVTSKIMLDTAYHVSVGDRLVIYFNTEDNRSIEQSGPIDLRMITRVYNDTIRPATSTIISSWKSAPVSGTQVCRRGNYIDVWAYLPLMQQQQYLRLYVDENSIAGGKADMYLTLDNPNLAPGQSALFYSSFHIEEFLRAHPDVNSFHISVAGAQSVNPVVELNGISLLPD
ncbi:MAG: hypothetical protein K2K40_03180 [Paramuribaculum sp.]|nr:hypothetical protein [Paramuribaculum sp.]